MLKILILTGDAGEAQEIYYAKYRLEEEGWRSTSSRRQKRPFLSVVHDFEPGFDTYTEKPGYRVQADLGLDEVDPAILPRPGPARRPGPRVPAQQAEGGRDRPALRRVGKPIAANCHGPLLVIAAGGAQGKTMTCYPDLEPDVRAAGAEFVNREVVVDGKLVSVRGWPDNGPWMREFVRLLKRTDVDEARWQAGRAAPRTSRDRTSIHESTRAPWTTHMMRLRIGSIGRRDRAASTGVG